MIEDDEELVVEPEVCEEDDGIDAIIASYGSDTMIGTLNNMNEEDKLSS